MASLRDWLLAARPRTLPAAVVPVAVGTALFGGRHPHWPPALACLGGALLIQIGCNFANDAFDALKGADTPERVGPARAVASGTITPRAMLAAAASVLALAFVIGLYLTAVAGWPVLVLGVVSIACAILYTGGPFPLAYRGLGDLFVFLFFGLAAVLGSAWVQWAALVPEAVDRWRDPSRFAHAVGASLSAWNYAWLLAAGVGLQCTAIIAVNNLRDIPTDAKAGKRTLAVRIGERASRWYYLALHLAAAACYAGAANELAEREAWLWAVPAVALAGGLALSLGVFTASGAGLNRYLARSAALEMLTGALLVIALSI
jgi:1,4-dihydroxy-2-naphthoate polyprenyltransferase